MAISDALVLVALHVIKLTGPHGQTIEINPDHVVSIRGPTDAVHPEANCTIFTDDSKFVAVVEECEEVNRLLEQAGEELFPYGGRELR